MVALINLRGSYYVVQNSRVDGKLKRDYIESLGKNISRKEAELILARYKAKQKRKLVKGETFTEVFEEFRGKYKSQVRAKRTFESFEHQVAKFVDSYGYMAINHIRYADIEAYKSKLVDSGYSNRSVNIALIEIGKVFKHAARTERIDQLPIMDRMHEDRNKEIERLLPDQVDTLLKEAPYPLKEYIEIMLGTGMRPKEFRELTWDDIHFKDKCIHIKTVFEKKRGRKVPLTPRLEDTFRALQDLKRPYPWQSRFSVQLALRRLCKKLPKDFHGVTPYIFRKTFASVMSENGVDRHRLADIMGNSPETLKKYYLNIEHESYRDEMNFSPLA